MSLTCKGLKNVFSWINRYRDCRVWKLALYWKKKNQNKEYNPQDDATNMLNGWRATFMFRPSFRAAAAPSCDRQDQFYLHKAPINSAPFSSVAPPSSQPQPILPKHQAPHHAPCSLWKHDLSPWGILHTQVRKEQPGAVANGRTNDIPKASKNGDYFPLFQS